MPSKVRVYGKAQNRTSLGIAHAYMVMFPQATLEDLRKAFPNELNPDKGVPEIFINAEEKGTSANWDGYFKAEDEFGYTKNNEQKKAVLSMTYYVNFAPTNRVLVCSLSVNEGKDTYKFYYDPELNCIYEYNENIKEELINMYSIIFSKDTLRHYYNLILSDSKNNR